MASSRACSCGESTTGSTSWAICALSPGRGIAHARDEGQGDREASGPGRTNRAALAGSWNLSRSQKTTRSGQSSFDAFAPSVLKLWLDGERNGLTLWKEIKEQGYTGTGRTVYRYLETLKQAEVKTPANLHRIQKFSATTAVWLFVRDPKTLDDIEREDLAAFCQVSTTLLRAYRLLQDFLSRVHKREGYRLDAWLEQIATSDLPELQPFANGREQDQAAVGAGFTWSIKNGPVEGQVTTLKLIKRSMYGRAGFPLLRQRVLHAL
jgi:transposase